ncbi:MAG: hydrogenase formation protein HypD [Pseudohaliea sp.]
MKYVDEYRDAGLAQDLAARLAATITRPWTIMEICGGQTHAIARFGLDQLLPPDLTLVHGPGCPVCVTPVALIDAAIDIANRPETTLCAYGDMLRVPGSETDLLRLRAAGRDVRIVYSPMDALAIAEREPERRVVHFAVGFETTAPAHAMAAWQARQRGIGNFSLLVAQVLVPPAMAAILAAPGKRVDGFLAAGHVCAVTGWSDYRRLAARYQVPVVVTGFEPVDILHGLALCLAQLEAGSAQVENPYGRAVREHGQPAARALVEEVFEVVPRHWRGLGALPASGLALREAYADQDALRVFGLTPGETAAENGDCIAGEVLRGVSTPRECPAFGARCTPEHPLGAPMVSSEGACAAYYRYRRERATEATP